MITALAVQIIKMGKQLLYHIGFSFIIGWLLIAIPKHVQAQNPPGSTVSKDTVATYDYDTLLKEQYRINYMPDKDTLEFLRPFFTANICEPGNYNHIQYKRWQRQADSLNLVTKKGIVIRLKTIKGAIHEKESYLLSHLKSIDEIMDCEFVPVPVYGLTYNIADYKDGANLKKYFSLDTSGDISYVVLKNKRMIGLARYEAIYLPKGLQQVVNSTKEDSISYHMVMDINKEPLAIRESVYKGRINFFGCLIQDHLVRATGFEGIRMIGSGNTTVTRNVFYKEYQWITIDAFFLHYTPGPRNKPYIRRMISDAYANRPKQNGRES